MDMETVLTAVTSAGFVAAAVGYAIKRIVDRSIDSRCSWIAESMNTDKRAASAAIS